MNRNLILALIAIIIIVAVIIVLLPIFRSVADATQTNYRILTFFIKENVFFSENF